MRKDLNGRYNGSLFTVLTLSTRETSNFSYYPLESESILLPVSKVKVLSNKISSKYNGLHEIEMISDDEIALLKYYLSFFQKIAITSIPTKSPSSTKLTAFLSKG